MKFFNAELTELWIHSRSMFRQFAHLLASLCEMTETARGRKLHCVNSGCGCYSDVI